MGTSGIRDSRGDGHHRADHQRATVSFQKGFRFRLSPRARCTSSSNRQHDALPLLSLAVAFPPEFACWKVCSLKHPSNKRQRYNTKQKCTTKRYTTKRYIIKRHTTKGYTTKRYTITCRPSRGLCFIDEGMRCKCSIGVDPHGTLLTRDGALPPPVLWSTSRSKPHGLCAGCALLYVP